MKILEGVSRVELPLPGWSPGCTPVLSRKFRRGPLSGCSPLKDTFHCSCSVSMLSQPRGRHCLPWSRQLATTIEEQWFRTLLQPGEVRTCVEIAEVEIVARLRQRNGFYALLQAEIDAESRDNVLQVYDGRQVVAHRQIGCIHLQLPGVAAEGEDGKSTRISFDNHRLRNRSGD
jgi:hypothetical protein